MKAKKITWKPGDFEITFNTFGMYIESLKFRGVDFMFPFQKVDYGDIKKPRGTHFCLPIFGKPPRRSALFGKIIQHGMFRHTIFSLRKMDDFCAIFDFKILPHNGYIWPLSGQITFYSCISNQLKISISVERDTDKEYLMAPVNIGFHPYWINQNGVSVSMNGSPRSNFWICTAVFMA